MESKCAASNRLSAALGLFRSSSSRPRWPSPSSSLSFGGNRAARYSILREIRAPAERSCQVKSAHFGRSHAENRCAARESSIFASTLVKSTGLSTFCTCFHRLNGPNFNPTGDPVGNWKRSSSQAGRCGSRLNLGGTPAGGRPSMRVSKHPEFGRNVQDPIGLEDSSAAQA
jgi:hypothetical protein